MNEFMNMGPSPEKPKINLKPEITAEQQEAEFLADYLKRHPNPTIIKGPTEIEKKVLELEQLMASFETNFPLEALHAIRDISPDLALKFRYADNLEDPNRTAADLKVYEKHNPKYIPEYLGNIERAKGVVLSAEDQKIFNLRKGALKALVPIHDIMKKLEHPELKAKSKLLMKAVGSLKFDINQINHD